MTSAEIKRRDEVARRIDEYQKESKRDHIDQVFVRAGHRPENRSCDHKHWRGVSVDGRYCSCGTCMFDPGD